MSDPNLKMSLLKISVILDSSPLLLNRILLTNVPLLLPVLHAAQARGLGDPAALCAESEAALKLRSMR